MEPGSDARGQAPRVPLRRGGSRIGYGIVALFVLTWTAAAILWRAARLEQRWGDLLD